MKHDTSLTKYAILGMHQEGYSAREIADHLEVPLLRVRGVVDPDYIAQKREEGRRKSIDRAFNARMKQQAMETALPPAPEKVQREKTIKEMMDIRKYDKFADAYTFSHMTNRLRKKMTGVV